MGYRVGGRCFTTEQAATDYKMSMVIPVMAADGSIKAPVRKSDGWYYVTTTTVTKPRPYPYTGSYTDTVGQQHKVSLTHPACDTMEFFKDGITVGVILTSLFLIAFIFRIAIELFGYAGGIRNEQQ